MVDYRRSSNQFQEVIFCLVGPFWANYAQKNKSRQLLTTPDQSSDHFWSWSIISRPRAFVWGVWLVSIVTGLEVIHFCFRYDFIRLFEGRLLVTRTWDRRASSRLLKFRSWRTFWDQNQLRGLKGKGLDIRAHLRIFLKEKHPKKREKMALEKKFWVSRVQNFVLNKVL